MFVYVAIVLAVTAWGAHLALRWKRSRDFAPELLKARQATGELPEGIDEAEFTDLYLRAEGPRSGTYVFTCAAIMTLALAPLSMMFNMVWTALWNMTGQPPVFEQGTLIHTFAFFLTISAIGIGLLAAAMRRYHALAPPSLKQVMRTLREANP